MASASIFLSLPPACSVPICLTRPCMEYSSHVWGGSTHTALLSRMKSKSFRLIKSLPLTDSWFFKSPTQCLSLFYCYFYADCSSELANYMLPPLPRSRCKRLPILLLILILSIFLMQELTSIFTLSSLTLVNSETLFLCLFFHLAMT